MKLTKVALLFALLPLAALLASWSFDRAQVHIKGDRPRGLVMRINSISEPVGGFGSFEKGSTTWMSVGPMDPVEIRRSSVTTGKFHVTLETQSDSARPILYGEGELDYIEGIAAPITIAIDGAKETRMVDLRGELILPKEWALRGLELDLAYNLTPFRDCPNGGNTLQSQRLGQFKRVPDKPGHYAFDFGKVLEGTHFLTLRPSGGGQYLEARMPFLLSPDAKDDLKFEIPEPALLTVHLVDSKTRKTIEGAYVMWQQVSGVCLQNIFPASGVESGVKIYRDLVPLGDITYCVTAEGYEYLEVAIKVVDGANEHTLELTPK